MAFYCTQRELVSALVWLPIQKWLSIGCRTRHFSPSYTFMGFRRNVCWNEVSRLLLKGHALILKSVVLVFLKAVYYHPHFYMTFMSLIIVVLSVLILRNHQLCNFQSTFCPASFFYGTKCRQGFFRLDTT